MTSGNEQELRSVFSIIWERRALAFSITGLAILAGIGYTLFAPSIWEAKATIVFPVRTPSLLGAGSFDQSSLTATLTGGPTPLKVFAGIIESESALGMVSQMTGLSRLDVRTMRTITEETMASSITIGARSSNPDLAKSVVNDHIIALRKINDTITKPLVANDAEVIKLQLDKQKLVLAAAENALLRFQQSAQTAPSIISSSTGKDSNIIPSAGRWADMLQQLNIQHAMLDSSINDASSRMRVIAKNVKDLPASLPPVDKWRGKLTDLEYDLQIKGLSLAEEAPEMVRLRKSIDVTKSELQSEIAKYSKAANAGMVDPTGVGTKLPTFLTQRVSLEAQIAAVSRLAKLAPAESIKLSQLTRVVTTQSTIVQQLQAQYQLASLQADRDPNHWEVLDDPRVDDKAVNKSFSKNGILSLIAGLALGAIAALFAPKRKVKAIKADPQISLDKAA